MDFTIGQTVTTELRKKYLETRDSAPHKVIYAKDSDRMSSFYDYYVFDKEAYIAKFGAVDIGGPVTFTVEAITDDVKKVQDPNLPAPDGGFRYTYYICRIH